MAIANSSNMIKSIEIQNFKSIQHQRIELENLNILIGQNGAGKSNFISLFKFLERLGEGQLASYIYQSGGIGDILFRGLEYSDQMDLKMQIYSAEIETYFLYCFSIISNGESYRIDYEKLAARHQEYAYNPYTLGNQESGTNFGGLETRLNSPRFYGKYKEVKFVRDFLSQLESYHFNDTSENASSRLPQDIGEFYDFKTEAENLAPFLLFLKENHYETYYKIVETTRLVFPLFHDFALEESPKARGKVLLRWKEKGSDYIFNAKQISDGTLRFISIATILIQPADTQNVPEIIILDEPELGLHPFAINVLAELLKKAALDRQVIVATQSVSLINHFTPKDLLIVERTPEGATEFKRKKDEDLQMWLEDYTLGQLWENNFFGGRP